MQKLCLLAFVLNLLVPSLCLAAAPIHTLEVEIFQTDIPLPIQTPVQEFFGGSLLNVQFMDIQVLCLTIIAAIVALAFSRQYLSPRLWLILSLGLASFLSILISLKLSQGWDELFINLRHSYVLSKTGHYSYNIHNMMEATVDFLPFFIVGILGKLSFPLIETIISLTLAGNILLIIASWFIARRLTKDPVSSIFFATGIGILPCVVYVGGTGFTATLFSAAIVWSIYFLFFCDHTRRVPGLILLGILTLIRTEGIAFAVLIWGYLYFIETAGKFLDPTQRLEHFKKMLLSGLYVLTPFILSLIIRKLAFGYPLPNPIAFKSTGGDPTYFHYGLEQLTHSIRVFYLKMFFLLALGPAVYCFYKRLISFRIIACLIITAAVCFIYFTGGGDWFPAVWNRYMMPFTILFILLCWVVMQIFFTQILKNTFILSLIGLTLVAVPFSAHGYAFAILRGDIASSGNRWQRIDSLGFFGRYLKMTTPEDTIICSPEMATVMYFAQRDLLDLLGIASPEIAHAPLTPISPGDLMHRRRFPATIEKHRPGILGFWGMDVLGQTDLRNLTDAQRREKILNEFTDFQFFPAYKGYTYFDIAYYRAGSYDYLKQLGYHYLIVATPQAAFYYLVHNSLYQTHVNYLKQLQIRSLGNAKIGYKINSQLEKQFHE